MIRLDKETHEYTTEGGITVPSVTQIIDRSGLMNKAWYTPEAQARGTLVHEITALLDQGIEVYCKSDDDYAGYIDAYLKFQREADFLVIEVEKRVYHPELMYAGTIDRIVELNGRMAVLDIKTGVQENWHAVQLAGYSKALEEPLPLYSLYLRANGTYSLIKHRNVRELYNRWISVLNTYKAGV